MPTLQSVDRGQADVKETAGTSEFLLVVTDMFSRLTETFSVVNSTLNTVNSTLKRKNRMEVSGHAFY